MQSVLTRSLYPFLLGLLIALSSRSAAAQEPLGYIDDLASFREKLAAPGAEYVMEMKVLTHGADSASDAAEPITETVTFERAGDRTRLSFDELVQIRDGALSLFIDEDQETFITREDTSAIGASAIAAATGVADGMAAYGTLVSETDELREYRFALGGLSGVVSYFARYDKGEHYFPYTRVEFTDAAVANGSSPRQVEVYTAFRQNPPRPAITLDDYLEPVRGDTLRPVAAFDDYTVLSMRPAAARPYILSPSL